MKRLVIVALVLAVIGSFAFADGTPKWSIGTWTGMGILSSGGANSVEQYDYNWVGGSAYRLGFTYTATDGNAGFNSRLQMGSPVGAVVPAIFNQLNAWGKMFGGVLTVRGGILDDYTIATKDWNTFGTTDGAFGLYVNITPMEGLDIGYFQPVPYVIGDITTALNPSGGKNAIIGAAFTMKDLLSVQLGAIAPGTSTALYFGAKLLAVKDLTFILEGKAPLESGSSITLLENVGYALGALNISARIGESIGSTFLWGAEPIISYKANDMISLSVIGNVYNDKSQTWMSPIDGGAVGGGVAGDGVTNFGAGAFITLSQSGASLIIGDYYAAASNGGNVVFVNVDLSL
jgi:hypothetical protein